MNKNYQINEILSAIDSLLSDNKKKPLEKDFQIQKPLILKKEVKVLNRVINDIPKSTEDIILQAEKQLKK